MNASRRRWQASGERQCWAPDQRADGKNRGCAGSLPANMGSKDMSAYLSGRGLGVGAGRPRGSIPLGSKGRSTNPAACQGTARRWQGKRGGSGVQVYLFGAQVIVADFKHPQAVHQWCAEIRGCGLDRRQEHRIPERRTPDSTRFSIGRLPAHGRPPGVAHPESRETGSPHRALQAAHKVA
jgi:hypothetical protein